jgi:hypothetical protein
MKHARIGVAALVLTAACGDVDWPHESLETDGAAINGGDLLTPGQHVAPHTSVVKIGLRFNECTAIKVASNVFWTSARCIDYTNIVGMEIKLTNLRSGDFENPQYVSNVASAALHPTWKNYELVSPLGLSPEYYDVARFTLTSGTPAIPSYSTTDHAWVAGHEHVQFTAYGSDRVDLSHSGQKQYASFRVATLGDLPLLPSPPDTDYYAHNFLAISFDPRSGVGDSGAPAFKLVGGTLKIVGILGAENDPDMTGFARYGNVRNWLAFPAVNQFNIGFRGFLFNQYTGRCISGAAGSLPESYCDGRDQDFDFQSWRLADSGIAGTFYLVNGSSGKCLDLETTADRSLHVQRTCNSKLLANNTQRFRFDATNHADYRRLVNHQTGRCTAPASPTSTTPSSLRSYTCSTADPTWRHQAWVMTR